MALPLPTAGTYAPWLLEPTVRSGALKLGIP